MDFAEQFEIYKQNVLPAMLEVLARDLGIKISSLQQLGVGFYPARQAWVFAERDHDGQIIGLQLRYPDGKKLMERGSKRGLVYPYNENYLEGEQRYEAGRCHWVRIAEAGIDCPICGKPDWCMVSSDFRSGPSAVLCSRISEGSTIPIGESGFLHRTKHQQTSGKERPNVLDGGSENLPTLIVEGSSDVLAALDLGFTAIGRPSATAGVEELKQMPLAGREIWIIGENDAGAGKTGMEKVYHNIKGLTEKVLCVMPPEGVKDLREWLKYGLDQEGLFVYVGANGREGGGDPNVFPDDVAQTIAKRFIEQYKDNEGVQTLRSFHGKWTEWREGRYQCIDTDAFRGVLYRYLDGKRFVRTTAQGTDISFYKPTRSKLNDILDALTARCPVQDTPPVWIERKSRPDIPSLIAFKNGLLDVDAYCRGEIIFLPATPDLFTFATLPYEFNPDAWSDLLDWFCNDVFNHDEESILLLAQWLGYMLVYDTSMEKFMMFKGHRRSGKSTILGVIEAMLGSNQCTSTSLTMLADHHGISNLVGKSAVLAGDIKGTIRKAEMDAALEIILRITGNDTIPINEKYIVPYDAKLSCRFTMAMNDLPLFTDHSRAIVARTLLLTFPNSYVGKEDFTLKDKLRKDAAEGKMINFALQGLKSLREMGRFIEPSASQEEMKMFSDLVSPVESFVDECCVLDPVIETSKDMMYDTWRAWCLAYDRRPGNKLLFCSWLTQQVPQLETCMVQVGNDSIQGFKGIDIKGWASNKFLGRPV